MRSSDWRSMLASKPGSSNYTRSKAIIIDLHSIARENCRMILLEEISYPILMA